jgi:hypothetical protein
MISDQVILTSNFPQRGYLTKYDVRIFSEFPFSSGYILSSRVLHLKQLGNIPWHSGLSDTDSKIFYSAAAQTSTQSAASQKRTSSASSSGPRPHSTCPSSNPSSMPRRQPNLSLSQPTIRSQMRLVGFIRSLKHICRGLLINELDMGMTYAELSVYGRLRKEDKLGPYGVWSKLLHLWGDRMSPQQVYEKVRWFFWCYSISTLIPSSIHISSLILSKQRLATPPVSTLQDTYNQSRPIIM